MIERRKWHGSCGNLPIAERTIEIYACTCFIRPGYMRRDKHVAALEDYVAVGRNRVFAGNKSSFRGNIAYPDSMIAGWSKQSTTYEYSFSRAFT